MQVIDFTPAKAVNPFAADAEALKALGVPTPEGKAGAISVPADQEASARTKFQEAAREAGFTARYRVTQEDKETKGNVVIVFTAREKDAAREQSSKGETKPAVKETAKKG